MPFDDVVMADWSGSSRPKVGKDSVWVAHGTTDGTVRSANHRTRAAAYEAIDGLVAAAVAGGRRLLAGFDFSFGYPAGFAAHLARTAAAGRAGTGVAGRAGTGRAGSAGTARTGSQATTVADDRAPWEVVWDHLAGAVRDDADNGNNRFEVAAAVNEATGTAFFWGCPRPLPALSPTKRPPDGLAANPLPVFRVAEQVARRQVAKPVKSGWQLYGGVTVGSQVLLGLPYLQALRRRHGGRVVVWPQQTGFVADPLAAFPDARVVLAEIWPTAFHPAYGDGVRDDEQVRAVVAGTLARQAAGGLADWFDPSSARQLSAEVRRQVVAEEGWILGG
ncbi:MAG TPA: hypothetical protein VHB02_12160 [Acidimicrobiales bacterium]|nr:hypothetical protein [Acidimicrobiales bacterium]